MSDSYDQIDDIIARKRAAVTETRRAWDVAMAELRSWEEAAKLLRKTVGSVPPPPAVAAPASMPIASMPIKRRGPKGVWTTILAALDREFPGSAIFGLNDVERIAESVGQPLQRTTVRSQMSNYAKTGIVERVEEGQFRRKSAVAGGVSLFKETAPTSSEEDAVTS